MKSNFKKLIKSWRQLSKKKKIVTSTIAVAMVCVITISAVFIRNGKGDELPQAIVQQAVVSMGNISNTIVGTGTLEIDALDSIKVPSGITIKEVNVESGDAVSKGDTLATVDKTSVLEAMETVQEDIESIDEQINDCKDSDETETITTKVNGTVKKICVKEGDSVTDCIAENGALIIIAVDGDSSETLEITASGGTVSKVHVIKKQSVSAGDTLLTIKKDEESTEYKRLIVQRKELAASLKKLTEISKTGTIVADIDGTVGEVNVSEGSESADTSSGSVGSSVTSSSSSGKSAIASQMSYKASGTKTSSGQGITLMTLSSTTSSAETTGIGGEEKEASLIDDKKLQLKIVNSGSSTSTDMYLAIPKTGGAPQREIESSDGSYNGNILWTPSDTTFKSGTTYCADVTLNAAEGYYFGIDSITQIQTGIVSGTTISEDRKTMTFHITFPATAEEKQLSQTAIPEETTTNKKEQNQQEQETSANKNSNEYNANGGSNEVGTGTGNTGNNPISNSVTRTVSSFGNQTVSSGQSTSDSNSDTELSLYSNEVTAFTLASNDSMTLSVNVDELDINSVAQGQEAQITLDAIEDKTFTGTVTKVGNSASSSGSGVAKYTVKVTIPKDEQMKSGMNASATIIVENKENVLTIPVNALQEKGDKTFVYTEQDKEGNLSGEMEVTTGLSDGDSVEITEGLSEGDTVYYQKTGKTSNQSFGGMSGERRDNYGSKGERPEGFGGRDGSGSMPVGGPGQGGSE